MVPTERKVTIAGWAGFLACSWTWCIGMFLPVLLVRDVGLWGFVVFAVPNIIGAAAVGWVIRSPEESRSRIELHWPAFAAFSIVTVAFHVFFVPWFVFGRLGMPAEVGVPLVGVALAALAAGARWRLLTGIIVYIVSLGAFGIYLFQNPGFLSAGRPIGALWLAPVCALGFLLCPHLDLTLHRARRELSAGGARVAFGWGYGALFLLMILFTICYAVPCIHRLESARFVPLLIVLLIGVHMIVQSCFTVVAHVWQLREDGAGAATWLALAAVVGLAGVLGGMAIPRRVVFGLDNGEVVYRLFLAWYGLVFPAYLLIDGRRHTWRFVGAVIVAAPLFWLGFIGGQLFWLVPGVGVVLAARLVGRRAVV